MLIITKATVSLWTRQTDWRRSILCQKGSNAPLPNPSCRTNDTVCGYVNLKNNIEEFQISEFSFPVGILVQLNELVEGDGIIVN